MKKHFFAFFLLMIASFMVSAQRIPVIRKHINPDLNLTAEGLAIQGHDPVAYFIHNKAVKCDTTYTVIYEDATYCFSSEVNKAAFLQSPKKYAPQYGGWCAYTMGTSGKRMAINPNFFKISDGKLYLFSTEKKANALDSWENNETILKSNADKFWAGFQIKP